MRPVHFFLAISLLLCGCSAKARIDDAQKAVELFHERMSAGQYNAIYDSATNSFKSAGPREFMQASFKRINRKMGICTEAKQTGWNINATTSGTFIRLGYIRKCANGDLQEQFIWKTQDGQPTLQRFEANSPLLLTD